MENKREGKKVKQRVLTTLGQFDALTESGKIDDLTRSLAKFASTRTIIDAHREGAIQARRTLSIGPALVFDRLWQQLGIKETIKEELSASRCRFPWNEPSSSPSSPPGGYGSDRAAERWKEELQIRGTEGHRGCRHLYRAMGWLGGRSLQLGHDARSMRCRRTSVERKFFRRNRDLFSELELVFFDTAQPLLRGARWGEPGAVRAPQGPPGQT